MGGIKSRTFKDWDDFARFVKPISKNQAMSLGLKPDAIVNDVAAFSVKRLEEIKIVAEKKGLHIITSTEDFYETPKSTESWDNKIRKSGPLFYALAEGSTEDALYIDSDK